MGRNPPRRAPLQRGGLLLGGFGFGGGVGVLPREALNAAGGVYQLLLARKEGVAVRADFHAQHLAFDRRARLEGIAAGAVHRNGMIVGVNTGFHEAPFCRGRSARLSHQGWRATAASLGREAIIHDTRSVKFVPTLDCRLNCLLLLVDYDSSSFQRVADSAKFAACSSWPNAIRGLTRYTRPPEDSSSGRTLLPYFGLYRSANCFHFARFLIS